MTGGVVVNPRRRHKAGATGDWASGAAALLGGHLHGEIRCRVYEFGCEGCGGAVEDFFGGARGLDWEEEILVAVEVD